MSDDFNERERKVLVFSLFGVVISYFLLAIGNVVLHLM